MISTICTSLMSQVDQMQDSQRQQFERLSAQIAEILGVLRGPARGGDGPEWVVARHVA